MPKIMGILNVTPDSFSDGGLFLQIEPAVKRAWEMVGEGADIIDIGGQSSRPGAPLLDWSEEASRVIPIIQALHDLPVPISIDSFHPEVQRRAIDAGAQMVNDIRGFEMPGALEFVASTASSISFCLMHMQGNPQTMQTNPQYQKVVEEVKAYLSDRVQCLLELGVMRERIYIDPGFGFGKSPAHNLVLLQELASFKTLGVKILVGLSRKSLIGHLLNRPVEDRLAGSLALALIAAMKGADVLRVHDVVQTSDALRMWNAVEFAGSNGSHTKVG